MKKVCFLIVLSLLLTSQLYASHLKGGYILYEYQSGDASSSTYKITVTMFFDCNARGPRDTVRVNIFNANSQYAKISSNVLHYVSANTVSKGSFSSCMTKPYPTICYQIYTYTETVSLPNTAEGYLISVTDQYRSDIIKNVSGTTSKQGMAITAQIPGTNNQYYQNTSPSFPFNDTAVICYSGKFSYQFNAIDTINHDSLSYSFAPGLNYTGNTPPYLPLSYNSGYSGTSPLGSGVTIDPATGLISGTAPSTTGAYVIAVYVKEWRQGVLIDSIKKELQIVVNDCSLLGASLDTVYRNCDSLTLTFKNESSGGQSNISYYTWNFGDATTSTNSVGTHTYTQAGTYTLSLIVANNDKNCYDSAKATVKIYPGFKAKFTETGSCYTSPFVFTDQSVSNLLDQISSWQWNFGDTSTAGTPTNTSQSQNTMHTYGAPQTANVILQVGSAMGCTGSDAVLVVANDKPYIYLPFTDTLICSIDTLPLKAVLHSTDFVWSPTTYMLDAPTMLEPRVTPKDTATYTITVHENGCIGSANIKVNVLQFITVNFLPDSMHVCKTDSIALSPISYALNYLWTESGGGKTLSTYTAKYPKAGPTADITKYHVQANLGHCPADSSITVYASPYPKASIVSPNPENTICYGDSTVLVAAKTAAYQVWSLGSTPIANDNLLAVKVRPLSSTTYTLSARDTLYCPKTVTESVPVYVVPPVTIYAGNDTTVVVGEPLHIYTIVTDTALHYPLTYSWSPATFLNYTDTSSPILTAKYAPTPNPLPYTVKASTAQGCTGSASIKVSVFTTKPDIFVPTAFTPSGNINNVLMPVPVGIAKFEYFKIYNRYGQPLFSTSQIGKGWDGTFNGTDQSSGTFVYMARGIDYLGNTVFRSGTVVLIR
ncbi:PKD domain-containing protein [Parasediminibacterium sp. JCM 36343]|uniref:PKD domain-containing protein n=1 Tax=Parasediminibacterium sp. JCM 36343 TaxID=3374279 RepID=UPI0039788A9B